MKIKEVNYYGLKHDEVDKRFGGELTYLRTFQIRGNTWAVYKAANPDRSKGHKDYMMLGKDPFSGQWYVSGSTPDEMEKERFQEAIICTNCDTLLYSINRHHFHGCGCDNATMVDGGKDYMRCLGKDLSLIQHVLFDLVTGQIATSEEQANHERKLKAREDEAIARIMSDSHSSENEEAKSSKDGSDSHSSEKPKRKRNYKKK